MSGPGRKSEPLLPVPDSAAKPEAEAASEPARPTGYGRQPGDPSREEILARMLRVDQAGEYGAKRIYDGQLAVLGRSGAAPLLRHMAAQERKHLETFDRLVVRRRVRPSLLSPLWHVSGFALGAGTALLGERAAMACTEAVEEVIDEHYGRQIAALGSDEADLKAKVSEFRAEEIEHRDAARAAGAAEAPVYPLLKQSIRAGARLAIWLAERF